MSNSTYNSVNREVEYVQQPRDVAEVDYVTEDAGEQPSGMFSTPGRAFALGFSLMALVAVFAAVIFLAASPSPATTIAPVAAVSSGQVQSKVPEISNISQTGAVTKGSVPPNFEWTDNKTGQKVSLASLKGKPVWINFWATWCPPCRGEMPEIQKVYNKHHNDLTILGVSMAPRDDPKLVLDFLNQYKYDWTFIHDPSQDLALKYQATSIPLSYFIGADGTIKAISIGGIQADSMEGLLAQAK